MTWRFSFVKVAGAMKRNVRFGLLLSDGEKTVLSQLAALEGGLSQAAVLRLLIRRAARELEGQNQAATDGARKVLRNAVPN